MIQVDDGIADAVDTAKAAALDEALVTAAVRVEPKFGSWSLRCPTEATGYQVPFEREPEVIMMLRMPGETGISGAQDSVALEVVG